MIGKELPYEGQLFSHSELGLAKFLQGLEEDLVVHAFVVGQMAVIMSAYVQPG
jgi:hypothetical protein